MAIQKLMYDEQLVGYRATFKNNVMYDLSLQAAKDLHIYPRLWGAEVNLLDHNGLLVSEDEIEDGVYAEDLSSPDKSEKAKRKFLRRDHLTGEYLKEAPLDDTMFFNVTHVLDISSEGAFELAKIRRVVDDIHWINVSLNRDPGPDYQSDMRSMPSNCFYSKYMDYFKDEQATIFNIDMLPDGINFSDVWSRYYEVYELWAVGAEEGKRVIVLEADEYAQFICNPMSMAHVLKHK